MTQIVAADVEAGAEPASAVPGEEVRRTDHPAGLALVPIRADRRGGLLGVQWLQAEPGGDGRHLIGPADVESPFEHCIAQRHPDAFDQHRVPGPVGGRGQGEGRHRGSREGLLGEAFEQVRPYRGPQRLDFGADVMGVQRRAVDEFQGPCPDPQQRFGATTLGAPVDECVQAGVGERAKHIGEYLDSPHGGEVTPHRPSTVIGDDGRDG